MFAMFLQIRKLSQKIQLGPNKPYIAYQVVKHHPLHAIQFAMQRCNRPLTEEVNCVIQIGASTKEEVCKAILIKAFLGKNCGDSAALGKHLMVDVEWSIHSLLDVTN